MVVPVNSWTEEEWPDDYDRAAASAAGRALGVIEPGLWVGDPPDRRFVLGTWIPRKQVTSIFGNGGVGKSLLMQQAASHIAMGSSFLGMDTAPMRALYLTTEDDPDELWRRQVAINEALGCTMQDVQGLLYLASWCGDPDSAVAQFDANLKLVKTEKWKALERFVREVGIRLIIADNVADLMAGEMNDVHQVAQFVNLWTGLAIEQDGAAVLIGHESKDGKEFFGSVAWNNKVRSRLLLKKGDREGDPDLRIFTNPKANYGPNGGEKLIRWHRGAFIQDSDLPDDMRGELEVAAQATGDNEMFLSCLRELTRQKRAVSESPSPTYAPRVFADMAESKGIGAKRLQSAMHRLFRLGLIERGELWRTDQRKVAYGLREVGQ